MCPPQASPPKPNSEVEIATNKGHTPCLGCGGTTLSFHSPYRYRSDAFQRIAPDLTVVRCDTCELLQAASQSAAIRADALEEYYRNSYRAQADIAVPKSPWDVAWFQARGRGLANLCATRKPETAAHRILEIGGGFGFNLDAMRARFPLATTFSDEIDTHAATARHGDHTRGSLSDGPGWDIVLLSHVLEHFPTPKQALTEIHERLLPGGVCVIEVPNEEHPMLERHAFLEPHLTFFTRQSLHHLLGTELHDQFEVVTLGTAGPLIHKGRTGLFSALKTLSRRLLAKTRLTREAYRFNFSNDTPEPNRIFLRALLVRR